MTERICKRCHDPLSMHAEGEDGFARPCCRYSCSCMCFTDDIHEEAVRKWNQENRKGVAPAGYCR